MGENEKQSHQPNLYEVIYPANRFKELINTIIDAHDEQTESDESTNTATWPDNHTGYHYKVRRWIYFDPRIGLPVATHLLEHYIDELPANKPLTRYAVRQAIPGSVSFITVLDDQYQEKTMDKESKKDAVRQALRILSDATPQKAETLLQKAFDNRYNEVIGSYILSDLALEGLSGEISEEDAWTAIYSFIERMEKIKNQEVERAKKTEPTIEYPKRTQPAYTEFVMEAAEKGRGHTNMNRYDDVDPYAITNAFAKQIKKWNHFVSPTKKQLKSLKKNTTDINPVL
jgi:hypothetical protein